MSRIPLPRRAALALPVLVLAPAIVLSSCAGTDDASSDAPSTDALPSHLVDAAVAKAEEILGDQDLSGSLSMIGVASSIEAPAWEAALEPFTTATGVRIRYTGSQDLPAIVQAGVDAGDPPDIVNTMSTAMLRSYAEDDLLLPLDDILADDQLTGFSPALLDSASVDGELYGVWNTVDVLDLWYNAATYDGPTSGTWSDLMTWASTATSDNAAFCMGLEAGAGTGWPAQVFLESLFLKLWGPQKFRAWADGELAWTSPEVTATFEQLGELASSDALIQGGATGILNRPFGDYVTGMFSEPQQCQLSLLGGYVVGLAQSVYPEIESPEDFAFMPVPAEDPSAASAQNIIGHTAFAFAQNDSPELRAALEYLASPEAQALLAASGFWQTANTEVDLDAYPTETGRALAQQLVDAEHILAGPTMAQSTELNMAWIGAIVAYLQQPDALESQLAAVDAVRAG